MIHKFLTRFVLASAVLAAPALVGCGEESKPTETATPTPAPPPAAGGGADAVKTPTPATPPGK